MNILYLIGNGFDIAQGLKTSYVDFYEFLKTQKPINAVASLMLEHIKGEDVELWRDMELKLGEFTKEVEDKELFEEFYYDLCDKLRTYLTAQEDSYKPTKEIQEKYIKDLVAPFVYLNERDKEDYRNYFTHFTSNRRIQIVSFNYTDVLEKSLDAYSENQVLPYSLYSYSLLPIMHVHGRLNTSYLQMGVNDEDQILNPEFSQDQDVWDYLVKPKSNYEIGDMVDDRFAGAIAEANLIVTMGLSFGETDSKWWKIIGNRMNNGTDIRVILFEHVKDLPIDPRKQLRIARTKRKEFLSKCGVEEINHGWYNSRIYVCLNKGLFNPKTYIFNDDRKGL